MKSAVVLFLISISVLLNAQHLVDTNNVWSTVECMSGGSCGTTVVTFGSDTLIGSYIYKKVLETIDTVNYSTSFVIAAREDTSAHKVYFYTNGDFLAYDFSLQQGDTSNNIWGFGGHLVIMTDSITLLNGEKRKRIYLDSPYQEVWIEGIGSSFGVLSPNFYDHTADILSNLNCYKENDTLKYANPSYPDCYYVSTGIANVSGNTTYTVSPMPFSSHAKITFNNPSREKMTLKIYDVEGRLVNFIPNFSGNEIQIERGRMTEGVYYFDLRNEKSKPIKGKLIIAD